MSLLEADLPEDGCFFVHCKQDQQVHSYTLEVCRAVLEKEASRGEDVYSGLHTL